MNNCFCGVFSRDPFAVFILILTDYTNMTNGGYALGIRIIYSFQNLILTLYTISRISCAKCEISCWGRACLSPYKFSPLHKINPFFCMATSMIKISSFTNCTNFNEHRTLYVVRRILKIPNIIVFEIFHDPGLQTFAEKKMCVDTA